ncbi:MAG: CpaD family pilus assembly lipoprotein [Micavibrio sp.]|nr:CpaD family pilus assembly lipoprotein [Micavibrio sp.]
MSTPSQVKVQQMQVVDGMKTLELPAAALNATRVNVVADDYLRNGKGAFRMVVPYVGGDPLSKVTAEREAADYKKAFAKRGLDVSSIDYAGVGMEDTGAIVVSYMSTMAQAPADCKQLTGSHGAATLEEGRKYKMGCELQTAMSQMIAHPEDLMGNAGTPDSDSRRQGAITEHFNSGVTNAPLNGLNASSTGTTTVTGGGISAGSKNPSNGGGG